MPEEKQELNIVMKASDILKKDEFHKSFKEVLTIVLRKEKTLERAVQELRTAFNTLISRIQKEHETSLGDLKQRTNQLFVDKRLKEMDSEIKKVFNTLQNRMLKQVDAKLKEADFKVSNLKPIKGDRGDKGDPGPMPTEHLELLKETKEELRKAKDILSNRSVRPMGRVKVPMMRVINLSDQVDGATRTFTLPRQTVQVLAIVGSQFPFTGVVGNSDFTLSGNSITLDDSYATPAKGQTLWAFTENLFYAKS